MPASGRVFACLSILLLAAASSAQDCVDYRDSFRVAEPLPYPGAGAAMASDGDLALLTRAGALDVVDMTDPDAVSIIGTLEFAETIEFVASIDRLAVVASPTKLIQVDLREPTAPKVIRSAPVPDGIVSMQRTPDRLLVTRGDDGVDIYACTPTEMSFLGNLNPGFEMNDATIFEGWLVAGGVNYGDSCGVVADISNPAAPVIVGSFGSQFVKQIRPGQNEFFYSSRQFDVDYVFYQLTAANVDEAGQATVTQSLELGYWPVVEARDGYLHLVGRLEEISEFHYQIYEWPPGGGEWPDVMVQVPSSGPFVLGSSTVLRKAGANMFEVYDIRNPRVPAPDPSWFTPSTRIENLKLRSGFLLRSSVWGETEFGFDYFSVYDVRDPEYCTYLHGFQFDVYDNCSAWLGDTDEHRAILAFDWFGADNPIYRLIDTRFEGEGGEPPLVTDLPYSGDAALAGGRIYQRTSEGDIAAGLAILGQTIEGALIELGVHDGPIHQQPFPLTTYLVVIQDGNSIRIMDYTDPDVPVERSSVPGASGEVILREGDRLYLRRDSDLLCLDIADVDAMAEVWLAPGLTAPGYGMAVEGELAVLTRPAGFQIFDLGDDGQGPVAVSPVFAEDVNSRFVCWQENTIYAGKMHVYDATVPSNPVYLGRGLHDWDSAVYVDEGRIVSVFGPYLPHCETTGFPHDTPPPAPPLSLRLQAAPNPFNPQTVIRFDVPMAGPARLSLYDLAGRRVRVLLDEPLLAGSHRIGWDGRDDQGRDQASGIYLMRLEIGSTTMSAKVALVR